MKIALLIPHRNDRPRFLAHLQYMISRQTLQPEIIHYVDYEPESAQKDITQRYRRGYDYLRNEELDAILLIEVDDWYSPTYIETTVNAWVAAGKPDLFGQRSTIYYHIKERGYFTMYHEQRSSAMSSLLRPDLDFDWCPDSEPYTDVWLYSKLSYKLFSPTTVISIGIKHGDGLTGGGSHVDRLDRYRKPPATIDRSMAWLLEHVDPVSFEFYRDYFTSRAPDTNSHISSR